MLHCRQPYVFVSRLVLFFCISVVAVGQGFVWAGLNPKVRADVRLILEKAIAVKESKQKDIITDNINTPEPVVAALFELRHENDKNHFNTLRPFVESVINCFSPDKVGECRAMINGSDDRFTKTKYITEILGVLDNLLAHDDAYDSDVPVSRLDYSDLEEETVNVRKKPEEKKKLKASRRRESSSDSCSEGRVRAKTKSRKNKKTTFARDFSLDKTKDITTCNDIGLQIEICKTFWEPVESVWNTMLRDGKKKWSHRSHRRAASHLSRVNVYPLIDLIAGSNLVSFDTLIQVIKRHPESIPRQLVAIEKELQQSSRIFPDLKNRGALPGGLIMFFMMQDDRVSGSAGCNHEVLYKFFESLEVDLSDIKKDQEENLSNICELLDSMDIKLMTNMDKKTKLVESKISTNAAMFANVRLEYKNEIISKLARKIHDSLAEEDMDTVKGIREVLSATTDVWELMRAVKEYDISSKRPYLLTLEVILAQKPVAEEDDDDSDTDEDFFGGDDAQDAESDTRTALNKLIKQCASDNETLREAFLQICFRLLRHLPQALLEGGSYFEYVTEPPPHDPSVGYGASVTSCSGYNNTPNATAFMPQARGSRVISDSDTFEPVVPRGCGQVGLSAYRLTMNDCETLLKVLRPICSHKWRNIAQYLDRSDDVNRIMADGDLLIGAPSSYMERLVENWLKYSGEKRTLGHLIQAVDQAGFPIAAQQLKQFPLNQ